MPILLLSGGRSPLPTRRVAVEIARLTGRRAPTIIEAAGHDVPATHGEELTEQILRDLAAPPRSALSATM